MSSTVLTAAVHLTIQADKPKPISSDLFGIFFEDLNYAADGGLYAELIQNRSFEYQATEQPTWNNLTAWELVTRGEGHGSLQVSTVGAIHPNNPHFAVLEVREPGEAVGLANSGFGGIAVARDIVDMAERHLDRFSYRGKRPLCVAHARKGRLGTGCRFIVSAGDVPQPC